MALQGRGGFNLVGLLSFLLLATLAPVEGYNLTALDDVRFLRSNRPLHRVPVLYDPGIVIVCQGCKRGFLGEDIYLYDAQHYLVVSVPVPSTNGVMLWFMIGFQ